jgi:DNA-binding transcriptional LysR family regulator
MDIRNLDLNHLVVIDAMFADRQTTKVAERLGISQPTVSNALRQLREFFHDDLFVREGNSMRPTPFAETLREPIHRIIQTVHGEIMREGGFDPLSTQRRFTFSMSDIGELVFLPRILAAFSKESPRATIRSLVMSPRDLESAMADGQVDLAIGYFPDITGGAFYQQKLFEQGFACLVRADHPTIGDTMTLEAFLDADHAVVNHAGRSQEIVEKRLRECNLNRRVLIQSPHFMSVPLIVANTDIVTTVPRAVALASTKMARVRLVEPPIDIPQFELKQLWHRRVHFDAAHVWLRGLVARLFLNKDPSERDDNAIFGVV